MNIAPREPGYPGNGHPGNNTGSPFLGFDHLASIPPPRRPAFENQHETGIVPEFLVHQGLVLDFDRTLGDVDNSMQRLFKAASLLTGFDVNEFRTRVTEAQDRVQKDGGTFEPLSILREQCDGMQLSSIDRNAYYNGVVDTFVELDEPPVLYDDAVRFLYMLQQKGIPHVFMTYGVSSEWQRLKVAAAGYPVGVDIMENSDKGGRIEGLRSDNNRRFYFSRTSGGNAQFVADNVCLVDDKPTSFRDLPEDCHGFLIRRQAEEVLESQKGETPGNVESVSSLDDLTVDDTSGVLRLRTASDPSPMRPDSDSSAHIEIFNYFQIGPWDKRESTFVSKMYY